MKSLMWILPALGLVCAVGILIPDGKKNVVAETVTKPGNEIIVTIGAVDRSAIAEADTLRKHFKFREAIAEYQKMLEKQGLPTALRAEAEYNIGLSHTWLGEYDQAMTVFNHMLDEYKSDSNSVGYAQYCLAWVEVQKGKYREAIARLERSLALGNITDQELAARIQFLVGRTYLLFLREPASARVAFKKVLATYPDTETAQHPYIAKLKGK